MLLALGATAVWVTIAWLAVIAARRRGLDLVWAIAGNAIALGLLLVVRHDFVPSPGGVVASLVCTFILVLTGGAAALLAHMEPASLLVARWRLHRARAEYERVVRLYEADREAAAVARQAWLGLVRSCVAPAAAGEEYLIAETAPWRPTCWRAVSPCFLAEQRSAMRPARLPPVVSILRQQSRSTDILVQPLLRSGLSKVVSWLLNRFLSSLVRD